MKDKLDLHELAKLVGEEIGASSWVVIDQLRIVAFADCS